MNLKFTDKIILLNALITALTISVIGYMVIQGILYFNITNTLGNLNSISDEVNLYIAQSINTQGGTSVNAAYTENVQEYAENINTNYNIKLSFYDNEGNILYDGFDIEPFNLNADQIYQTLTNKKRSYVYTEVNKTNHIFFSSPIIINKNAVGAFTISYSMQQIDETIRWVIQCFIYATLIVLMVFIPFSYIIYSKLFNPILKLEKTSEQIALGNFDYEKINYKQHDEIGKLIDSYEYMASQLSSKINTITLERESLNRILSGLDDAVLTVNNNKDILTFNQKAAEYFGNDIKISLFNNIPELSEMLDRMKEEKSYGYFEFCFNDMFFLSNANILKSEQENTIILIMIRNITASKTLEIEQRKFISSVSHELRTPLTTIIGYVDMLQRRGTENKELTKKALDYAKRESIRLLRLVTDLLNITKYNSVEFEFVFNDVNVNNLLEDCIYTMQEKCEQHNIEIQYFAEELPLIKGDYDRLKQVIINVMDNAFKYSNEGDAIKLVASFENNEIEISVRDYGEGIPDNAKEKVFEAFYRVEEDRSRKTGGTGLGLSIVKYIVEKHNGTILIESEIGNGTRVIIKLPVKEENGYEKK